MFSTIKKTKVTQIAAKHRNNNNNIRHNFSLPNTNITGTEGGSNLIFPAFDTAIPLTDVPDVPERLSPRRRFHSASSESGAVEFASANEMTNNMNNAMMMLNRSIIYIIRKTTKKNLIVTFGKQQ